jgi:tripartite-type tricarboxylate transporter receptor subunit TctC
MTFKIASAFIGADHVAKSPPDGYTFLLISGSFLTNPALTNSLPFDPLKDFAPLTPAASSTPEQYAAFIKFEMAKWAQVVNRAGIRNDPN